MGSEVESQVHSRAALRRQGERVRHTARVLGEAVAHASSPGPFPYTVGAEIELSLIGDDGSPAWCNDRVLARLDDKAFQDELARFNVEINLDPLPAQGAMLTTLHRGIAERIGQVRDAAASCGAGVAPMGLLPTVDVERLPPQWMSEKRRYAALATALGLDGEGGVRMQIGGPFGERYEAEHATLAPEAACTSLQLHYAAPVEDAPAVLNAAHVALAPLLGVGANAPFFAGRALWHESRIPVFTQILDARPAEHVRQDVLPRVHTGTGWVQDLPSQVHDSPLLHGQLLAGAADHAESAQADMAAVALHQGTVYSWVRPLLQIQRATPQFRIENRVLPAGPTAVDMVANAAFFFGLIAALTPQMPSLTRTLDYDMMTRAMWEGAFHGPFATVPDLRGRPRDVCEYIISDLLPLAASGLDLLGVHAEDANRYLGVVEKRAVRRRTGSCWQLETVQSWHDHGVDRHRAVREMLLSYVELSASDVPVHEW